jgi:hypothetical protein
LKAYATLENGSMALGRAVCTGDTIDCCDAQFTSAMGQNRLLTEFPNDLSQGYEMPKRTYESWKPDAKIQNALLTSGLTVPTSGVSGTHRRTIAT